MRFRWIVVLTGLLLVTVLGLSLVAWLLFGQTHAPPADVRFRVQAGDRLKPVLRRLEAEQVIRYPRILYAYARLTRAVGVKRGVYAFTASEPLTMAQVLGHLSRGDVLQADIRIIEGHDRWQLQSQLVNSGWMDANEFDALCDDLNFLRANRIPGPTCEGYLAPDTYRVALETDAATLFTMFFNRYKERFNALRANGAGPLNLSEKQLVTLASIVEKETGHPAERGHVACVFYNRLRRSEVWKLQTDPTVIYARKLTGQPFDGDIRKSDLQRNHPYNTYARHGLPPGPIANPGEAALAAVLNPSVCKDYFFVAMGSEGRHQFCPDAKCHMAAVKKWQLGRRNKRGQQTEVLASP